MFFRREKPRLITFEERLQRLRQLGFETQAADGAGVRVSRSGCAAVIEDRPGRPKVNRAGWIVGSEIALLADAGYQKFWRTPSGRRIPALAQQLHSLHDFDEDLWEALGLESLYNEALGTTNDLHLYDRVEGRDRGVERVWRR